jgi:hypothetical protein
MLPVFCCRGCGTIHGFVRYVPKGEKEIRARRRGFSMFEMYVTCPTTGQPTYGGVISDDLDRKAIRELFENSICPACGTTHAWQAGSTWLEIPLAFPEADMDFAHFNSLEPDQPDTAAVLPRAAA